MLQWAGRCQIIGQHSLPYRFSSLRRYSVLAPSASEQVIVPCKGNGSIALEYVSLSYIKYQSADKHQSIYHPTSLPPPSSGPATVVLYLPRGPLQPNPADDVANALTLRSGLPYTVAQVNYRLSRRLLYPTPVHDVLAGYDWISAHLLPKRSITRPGRSEHVGRIAVVGELIGGSLSTMLALTECRRGEPGVFAAAVNNPVVDWVLPDTVDEPTESGNSTTALLQARQDFFPKPTSYFDPFASPLLFFRTPGAEVPVVRSEVDDMTCLSMIEREDFYKQQMMLSGISSSNSSSDLDDPAEEPAVKKKASRLFPSKNLNLELPSLYVSSGDSSPLHGQAVELSQAMRKSITRAHKAHLTRVMGFGRKVLQDDELDQMDEDELRTREAAEEMAQKKVCFKAHEGIGLWDQSPSGRRRMEDAVAWLKEKLGG